MPPSTERRHTAANISPQLCGLILVLYLAITQAAWARPLVILSEDTPSYAEVLKQLSTHSGLSLDSITADTLASNPDVLSNNALSYSYFVTVGTKATSTVLQHLRHGYLVAVFLPRRSYEELITQHSQSPLVQNQRATALYLDQPYVRQLRLAKIISPRAQVISTAFSTSSIHELPLLQEAASLTGLKLSYRTLSDEANPIKQLQPLIQQSDLFLALPDQAIFNRSTAKWILYMTLRQRVPMLGFSEKYVAAGATAGVYSTPAQIGRQAGELLRTLINGKNTLPAPAYPRYFSVSTNETAARTLRLRLPDKTSIEATLSQEEQ